MFIHSLSDRFAKKTTTDSCFSGVSQCLYTLTVTDFLKEGGSSFSGVSQCFYTLTVTDFLKE